MWDVGCEILDRKSTRAKRFLDDLACFETSNQVWYLNRYVPTQMNDE